MNFPSALIEQLRSAKKIAVLTGAGISAESGVPTFRDAQTGLWARFRPEDLATPEAFLRDPKLVWEWYAWRRQTVAGVSPNPGHLALAKIESLVPGFTLITQNVDGLHQRAGSRNVIEIHGNITRTKCFEENVVIDSWPETGHTPPHCPRCGAFLRPDVVWFGEALPADALENAEQASAEADLFFSIGTSSLVYPAANLPLLALRQHKTVVEINPASTSLTPKAHFTFQSPSGVLLPELVKAVWPKIGSV